MNERDITKRLAGVGRPPVPPDLADRIKDEIPEELFAAESEETKKSEPSRGLPWRQQKWLLAASLVMAIGAAFLLFRVRPTPEPALEETAVRSGSVESRPSQPTVGEDEGLDQVAQDEASTVRAFEADPVKKGLQAKRDALAERRRELPGATTEAPLETAPAAGEREYRAAAQQRNEEAMAPTGRVADRAAVAKESSATSRLAVAETKTARQEAAPPEPEAVVAAAAPPRADLPRPVARPEADALDLPRPPRRPPPSTGGTAEPNDETFDRMFFRSSGVNPFIDTDDDRFSTFGLDVDTGSYTLSRRYLGEGHLPPAEAIRVEEFVNFFDYGDEPPVEEDFAIRAEGSPSPFTVGPAYRVLRFTLSARQVDPGVRKPAILTFLVDVSGSMGRGGRLGQVQRALSLLLDQLEPGDRIGLVVYSDRARVLLEPTPRHGAIRGPLYGLVAGGSTNLEDGLVLAYEMAARAYRRDAINRVILCSDGVANVGRTGAASLLERVGREAERGVELATVGFGIGNYNDVLMEQLADRGDGSYAYVDSAAEARRVFVENLTGTLQTVATDAKVQVEFNPEVVTRYRLLGYENRNVADPAFRDDSVDAGEVGAGRTVTALYEIKLASQQRRRGRLATLRLRYRSPESGRVEEMEERVEFSDLASSWEKASPALRLAALVAEFAEILKGSYWARDGDLGEVFREAQVLLAEFPDRSDVAEFVSLVGKARDLSTR